MTRQEETPRNKWIEKYPIITSRKFTGDYESLKTKLHYEHGIENVRSDEDYFDSLILSPIDEYNYTVKLDEYDAYINQDCDKCGYWGHFEENCTREENIMGYPIFENMEPEEEYIDDDEWEEEEEEEEYVSWRRFR